MYSHVNERVYTWFMQKEIFTPVWYQYNRIVHEVTNKDRR